MRIIALINQKGGVGKTTSVANLAAAIAGRGLNVGLIDLDPQSHLTMHFGVEPGRADIGAYDVLTDGAAISSAAILVQPNLWLVPASIDLAAAEVELVSAVGREQLLADRLAEPGLPYDYVLMDCPPSLGLLTLNALAAADEVLIPLQPHFLALQGLGKLLETASLVRQRINPRLRVSGVVLCMYESGTRLAAEVTEDIRSFLTDQGDPTVPWADARLFDARIRRNIKLAECPSFGQTIFDYAPDSNGAADYNALATEFLLVHGHDEALARGDAQHADSQRATLAPPAEANTPPHPPEPATSHLPEPHLDQPARAIAPEPTPRTDAEPDPAALGQADPAQERHG